MISHIFTPPGDGLILHGLELSALTMEEVVSLLPLMRSISFSKDCKDADVGCGEGKNEIRFGGEGRIDTLMEWRGCWNV